MAVVEYWIQLENRPWDACPSVLNIEDRMTGLSIAQTVAFGPVTVDLTASSAPGSAPRQVQMHNPLRRGNAVTDVADALILRRYRPPAAADGSDAWTVPTTGRSIPGT